MTGRNAYFAHAGQHPGSSVKRFLSGLEKKKFFFKKPSPVVFWGVLLIFLYSLNYKEINPVL